MAIDPGFYFPHVAFNAGTGKSYLLSPQLGGTLALLMKLKRKVNTLVNKDLHVVRAYLAWLEAEKERALRVKEIDAVRLRLFGAAARVKKEYDRVLDGKRKTHPLTKRLIDLDMKMEYEVKKARNATTYFLSQFYHALECMREGDRPDGGKDPGCSSGIERGCKEDAVIGDNTAREGEEQTA
jgi:hypothetical protein